MRGVGRMCFEHAVTMCSGQGRVGTHTHGIGHIIHVTRIHCKAPTESTIVSNVSPRLRDIIDIIRIRLMM